MRERFGQAERTDVHRAYRRRSAIARPESSEALSAEFPLIGRIALLERFSRFRC